MMRTRNQMISAAAVLLATSGVGVAVAAAPAGPAALPNGSEPVKMNPADFTTRIDNRYWPMRKRSRWVYRETDNEGAKQRVVVTVTRRTKLIANGVRARVVRDVVTERGVPVEVTDDYYAQDRAGNIWYLGEATTEYENGKPISTEGSFEAGVDGAQAEVPFGHFKRVLMTRNTNPLEPKSVEFKFYARGVGPVLAIGVSGGSDREDLVRFRRG